MPAPQVKAMRAAGVARGHHQYHDACLAIPSLGRAPVVSCQRASCSSPLRSATKKLKAEKLKVEAERICDVLEQYQKAEKLFLQ